VERFEEADRGGAPGYYRGGDRGALARVLTECGDRGRALALVASLREDDLLPKGGRAAPMGAWAALVSAVEVLVVLREREEAGRLHALITEGLATGAVLDLWGGRLLERIAGMAAAAAGRWDLAEAHFEAALAQAAALPHRIEQPEVRVAYAAMLIQRDEPGDRERARVLAAEAVELYHALGIGNRAGLAHHIVWAYTGAPGARRVEDGNPQDAFRREGDVWLISFAGRTARVRDAKGMHHVARLLREPGREVHALDLAGGTDGLVLGDAGPELDDAAKATYRRRLGDLAEDLEEAQAFNDVGRAAKVQDEIDALTEELTRAVGLGGRDRRAASAAERARLNVTRAVRSAIARIAASHPPLGDHLQVTVRTGTYCSYQPDPSATPTWDVSER
jgi:tetratricopeptide (TPR) repeat protein